MSVTDPPFLGTEALAAGVVNRYQLATAYDAVVRNVFVPKGYELTPVTGAPCSACQRLPPVTIERELMREISRILRAQAHVRRRAS
jgi:hypothetical protein